MWTEEEAPGQLISSSPLQAFSLLFLLFDPCATEFVRIIRSDLEPEEVWRWELSPCPNVRNTEGRDMFLATAEFTLLQHFFFFFFAWGSSVLFSVGPLEDT